MIAELFYPKELREVIADLKAKDDLNEAALRRMNGFIYKRLGVYLGMSSVAFLLAVFGAQVTWERYFFVFSGLVLLPFGPWELLPILKIFPVTYAKGKKVDGQVKRFYIFGLTNAGWKITYLFFYENKKRIGSTFRLTRWIKPYRYSEGDPIKVYVNPEKPEQNVPLTPSLYSLFQLRKEN